MTEEIKMEECPEGQCPTCQKAAVEAEKNQEMSMAFLLALLPVITLTFFGQVGLL